ncbi:hypothetical protein COCC4DRAFT_123365 [Bipolaris maydis ATCC 48331]|uniref:Uncharacterized protein n=2 Tax=Cochliobolus heterostrophus TaxID=5016 RepID=M2V837_COCH5|nr:uncharacterized protein COCC4DRAFT_123365 [Bipolaris maydis ATCC 48331]EMD95893.1 hypothetical protein COCHEDRAFT_1026704 [Bipolaris maydis C5]ENI10752.1 hypothetical protein COCC4DRAFT_123365 [Bipolaris maydis ATCC 48331]
MMLPNSRQRQTSIYLKSNHPFPFSQFSLCPLPEHSTTHKPSQANPSMSWLSNRTKPPPQSKFFTTSQPTLPLPPPTITITPTNPLTNLPLVSHDECIHLLKAARISYTHMYMALKQHVYHDLASACGTALNQLDSVGEDGDWKGVMVRFEWKCGKCRERAAM